MKKVLLVTLIIFSMIFAPIIGEAKSTWVNGYTKSNGTYVQGHYRSAPDGNPYNNWSFPGNTNPYTGKTATGDPDTYLNNYYNNRYTTPTYSPSFQNGVTPAEQQKAISIYELLNPSCPFHSKRNSSGTCTCDSTYVANGSVCVPGVDFCREKYGQTATYNAGENRCYYYPTQPNGLVLGDSTSKDNPLGLQTKSLVKSGKYNEVFYINDSLCLQWIMNEKAAERYFGRWWFQNIRIVHEFTGYKFCDNLN